MEDNWWGNSEEDYQSTTSSRREDRLPPLKYKAKGRTLGLLGCAVAIFWLSLSLAGTTSDFAEEIVFP